MTIWTPSTAIGVKVIGPVWRDDELLLVEVEESSGRVKGVRPLGGCVEFGETREQALHREFEEELGCGITLVGPWHSFESIYEHEGATAHEYLFAANIPSPTGRSTPKRESPSSKTMASAARRDGGRRPHSRPVSTSIRANCWRSSTRASSRPIAEPIPSH